METLNSSLHCSHIYDNIECFVSLFYAIFTIIFDSDHMESYSILFLFFPFIDLRYRAKSVSVRLNLSCPFFLKC